MAPRSRALFALGSHSYLDERRLRANQLGLLPQQERSACRRRIGRLAVSARVRLRVHDCANAPRFGPTKTKRCKRRSACLGGLFGIVWRFPREPPSGLEVPSSNLGAPTDESPAQAGFSPSRGGDSTTAVAPSWPPQMSASLTILATAQSATRLAAGRDRESQEVAGTSPPGSRGMVLASLHHGAGRIASG
jgi:hypothetical protein